MTGWCYGLTVLASLGIFGTLTLMAHWREVAHPWLMLALVTAASFGCLALTRRREAWDLYFTFWAILMGIFSFLMLVAGDPSEPVVWKLFLIFSGATVISVALTRNRLATVLAIGLTIAFGLLKALVRWIA